MGIGCNSLTFDRVFCVEEEIKFYVFFLRESKMLTKEQCHMVCLGLTVIAAILATILVIKQSRKSERYGIISDELCKTAGIGCPKENFGLVSTVQDEACKMLGIGCPKENYGFLCDTLGINCPPKEGYAEEGKSKMGMIVTIVIAIVAVIVLGPYAMEFVK